ncbi:MAG: transcription antitermination factor NusB [bacterium]
MTGRHEARLMAVQFLFQVDFNGGELPEALVEFWSGRKAGPKLRAFMEELVHGVLTNKPAIDEQLQRYAANWEIKRMGGVDRNVMRVALFEMMHRDDIPPVVSINEAVNIAKELSTEESGKFVNGILDRARKDMVRPARAAMPARTTPE